MYAALTMSRCECAAKGIAAISLARWQADPMRPALFTVSDILRWQPGGDAYRRTPYEKYASCAEEYFRTVGTHLHLVTEGFQGGLPAVRDVCARAEAQVDKTGKPAVVILDPFETVCPDMNRAAVLAMKALAARLDIPVILSAPCTMKRAEEEGDADVVLDWELVDDDISRGYRPTRITVQKNRRGASGWKINFAYLPGFGSFFSDSQWDRQVLCEMLRRDYPDRRSVVYE